MKTIKFLSLLFLLSGSITSWGQLVQLIKADTTLELVGKQKSVEYDIELSFYTSGTATKNVDLVLQLATLRPVPLVFTSEDGGIASANGQSIKITFTPDQFPGDKGLNPMIVKKKLAIKLAPLAGKDSVVMASISFIPSSNVRSTADANFIVTFVKANSMGKADNSDEKKRHDVLDICYLNAYNFSINGPLLSNYLGRLDVFDQKIANSPLGLRIGFTTINYSIGNSDSLNAYFIQKISPSPLADSITAGQKYAKQLNQFTTKQQNYSFSIYAQPMYSVIDKTAGKTKIKFYIHGHVELLVNKNTITTSITTLKQDSVAVLSTVPIDSSFFLYQPSSYSRHYTYLNGYYGIGGTLYLKPIDSLTLFLQATVGCTTDYPNLTSVNGQLAGTPAPPHISAITPYPTAQPPQTTDKTVQKIKGAWFYYIHGYITYNVTNAIQGLVGAEIRGIFPRYPPFYAVYAGMNLDIKSLFAALK